MIKFFPCLLIACLLGTPTLAENPAGVRTLPSAATDPHQYSLTLWYPARSGGTPDTIGGNAVFVGQKAMRDAPILDGRHPLVILSHGGMRSAADSGAWLAARLARAGIITAELNLPRPEADETIATVLRARPQQLQSALRRILNDPTLGTRIDQNQIAVVGHAIGGRAALAEAAHDPDADMPSQRAIILGTDYLSATDLENMTAAAPSNHQKLLITLGGNTNGLEVPLTLPRVDIAQADRFDAFSECTRKGAAILAADGGAAALCATPPANRRQIHDQIAAHILRDLQP